MLIERPTYSWKQTSILGAILDLLTCLLLHPCNLSQSITNKALIQNLTHRYCFDYLSYNNASTYPAHQKSSPSGISEAISRNHHSHRRRLLCGRSSRTSAFLLHVQKLKHPKTTTQKGHSGDRKSAPAPNAATQSAVAKKTREGSWRGVLTDSLLERQVEDVT